MAQRKKWDPKRMNAAIEAMRNKEVDSYKASRVFNIPQTTLEHLILKTGRKAQMKQSKQDSVGSKFFFVKQKMIWLSTVF
jgi:hypothetical protein